VRVRRRLVVRAVVVAPRRHDGHRLEEHRRPCEREQLDLLVHVVDRHVVHALEQRHGLVEELQAHRAALAPRVGPTGLDDRLFLTAEHRLEALPVGERAQRWVLGHQVVEVRRARTRLADDEDRTRDLEIEDLGMPAHEVLDTEPVAQVPDHLRVRAHPAERGQARLIVEAAQHERERFAKPVVPELVEPRVLRRGVGDRVERERQVGRDRLDRLHDLDDVRRELRVGEVVDPDGNRALGHGRGA
jgi:hypothetical protein